MRTTVEIGDEQHRALSALAQRRRLRGFSVLVQEALDAYLHDQSDEETAALLALQGSLSESEADEVESRIAAVRSTWRSS